MLACSTTVAVIAAVLVSLVAYVFRKREEHFSKFAKLGIPGPPPSIFWGNLSEISRKSMIVAQTDWHKKYGKVLGFYFGYNPCLLVADGEMVKNILLKDFHNFTDRACMSCHAPANENGGLSELKGQRWKMVRSTLTPSFTSSKLKALTPEVSRIVDLFIENVDKGHRSGNEIDLFELYQALTLDTICRSAMGVSFDVQKELQNSEILMHMKAVFSGDLSFVSILLSSFPWLRSLAGNFIQRTLARFNNKGKDPLKELRSQCKAVVKYRRANRAPGRMDLLQLMMDAEAIDDSPENLSSLIAGDEAEQHEASLGPKPARFPLLKPKTLNEELILSNASLILLAGYETTSSSLAFITRILLRFPGVQEAVREELLVATENGTVFDFETLQKCHYLESVIRETLRMYPPVHSVTSRHTNEETTYGNIRIPKGMNIFISTRELHYDEEVFPNPQDFQPERFLPGNRTPAMSSAWVPFGLGPRNCIGMRFAQMEIKIALAKLLTKYRIYSEREPKGPMKCSVVGNNVLESSHLYERLPLVVLISLNRIRYMECFRNKGAERVLKICLTGFGRAIG